MASTIIKSAAEFAAKNSAKSASSLAGANGGFSLFGGKMHGWQCGETRAVSFSDTMFSSDLAPFHLPACNACGPGGVAGKPISERNLSAAGASSTNRGVIFMGPNDVEVKSIPFPKLELDSTTSPVESERQKRKCEHGAILKVVTTNICGSDQHMVRGRTSLPGGHMVRTEYHVTLRARN
jgi:hypothetical protein